MADVKITMRAATYANVLAFVAIAIGIPLADSDAWWRYLGEGLCYSSLAFLPFSLLVTLSSWWNCLRRPSRDHRAQAILNTFVLMMLGKLWYRPLSILAGNWLP
jgi:hypothetical protein